MNNVVKTASNITTLSLLAVALSGGSSGLQSERSSQGGRAGDGKLGEVSAIEATRGSVSNVALRSRAAVLTESSDARDSSAGGRASDIRLGGDLDDLELFILGVSQGHVDGLVVNKAIEL
jgi:hypothetical protein